MLITMKRLLSLALVALITLPGYADTLHRIRFEDGGTGPYKAEIVEDSALPGYSIVRPADLAGAAAIEGPLPVVLFGNGGCTREFWGFENFLTHLASYGYVVITNGAWAESRPRRAPQQGQPMDREAMLAAFKQAEAGNAADARDYLRALDWLQKEAGRSTSEYYQAVDVFRTAAMGQSCGGLQALILGTAGDPRIKTTVPLNSGVTSPGDGLSGMISKEDLAKLEHPTCYLIGGRLDDAFKNAADDFKRIAHVPVVIANLEVGHGGTYREANGGSFGDMALLWLDWQLKGANDNELIFRYGKLPAYLSDWTVTSRNFASEQTLRLYEEKPAENTEVVTYNDLGEISSYRMVNDPTLTVRLPDPDKADGSAVLIFPGGALVSLSWETEFTQIADWLNARGIAAIGVKYRLKTSFAAPRPLGPRPAQADGIPQEGRPAQPTNKFLAMQGRIYDFVELDHANTNPQVPDPSDRSTDNAAEDALRAMAITKAHASEWHIDPDRIGWMGFSAGGGVELAALMKAAPGQMPAWLCSVYGPSLVDITVPKNAPKLFVAVHADHINVAAGCMALFMEWKKAGIDSEIHVYGANTGGFYGGGGNNASQKPTPEGIWLETFYSWLKANAFVK